MRAALSSLLLLSTVLPFVNTWDISPGSNIARRHNPDRETLAFYEKTGLCFNYLDNCCSEKSLQPCKIFCEEKGSKTVGCGGSGIARGSLGPGSISQDDDGNDYTLGQCLCDAPIIGTSVDKARRKFNPFKGFKNKPKKDKPKKDKPKKDKPKKDKPKKDKPKKDKPKKDKPKKDKPKKDKPKKDKPKKDKPKKDKPKKDKPKKDKPKKDKPKKDKPKKDKPKKDKPKKDKPKKDDSCSAKGGKGKGKKGKGGKNQCKEECRPVKVWEDNELKILQAQLGGNVKGKREVPLNISELSVGGLERRAPPKQPTTGKKPAPKKAAPKKPAGQSQSQGKIYTKDINFCGDITVSQKYPSKDMLLKLLKNGRPPKYKPRVIYSAKDPSVCDNFVLGRQPASIASKFPSGNDAKKNPDTRLEVEHVLEGQVVSNFFDNINKDDGKKFHNPYDKKGPDVDFCTYIRAYWHKTPQSLLPKLDDNLPTKSVALQLPSDKKHYDEFFLLQGAANNVKADAWVGQELVWSANDQMKKLINRKDFGQMSKPMGQTGLIRAIQKYKFVMYMYQYHTKAPVKKALVAQANRVGKKIGELDKELGSLTFKNLQSQDNKKKFEQNYTPKNLEKRWKQWMKKTTQKAIDETEDYLEKQMKHFVERKKGLEAERKKLPKNDQKKRDRYTKAIGFIKEMKTTYEKNVKKTKWTNPF